MVSKPHSPEVMGNTSDARVSNLSNDDWILLEEEEWNELFGKRREFTNSEGFSSEESKEIEAGNISENIRTRSTKEVSKIVIRSFYKTNLTKRGYRKQMMKIWREIRVSEVTEQRLADQTRVVRANGWSSEAELNEIQRKIKKGENMEEPKIELQNRCGQQRPQNEDDIELTNTENLFNRLQDQGLTNNEIRLVEEEAALMKTDKAPPNLRNVERK